jgi:hypothetical protein
LPRKDKPMNIFKKIFKKTEKEPDFFDYLRDKQDNALEKMAKETGNSPEEVLRQVALDQISVGKDPFVWIPEDDRKKIVKLFPDVVEARQKKFGKFLGEIDKSLYPEIYETVRGKK